MKTITINRNDLLRYPGEGALRIEMYERLQRARRQNFLAVRALFRGPEPPDPVREFLNCRHP